MGGGKRGFTLTRMDEPVIENGRFYAMIFEKNSSKA